MSATTPANMPAQDEAENDELSKYIRRKRKVKAGIMARDELPQDLFDLYNANATQSRLLLLPPEIRNRIYDYVLGGKSIHVYGSSFYGGLRINLKHRLCRSICQIPESEKTQAETIKSSLPNVNHLWRNRHLQCNHKPCDVKQNTTLDLNILLACHQTHQEAALMPFQENTFLFDSIISLEAFVEFLIPAQVKAVRTITFEDHFFHSTETFEKRLQAKLTGLRDIYLYTSPIGNMEIEEQRLLRFKRLPIESATVVPYFEGGYTPGIVWEDWAKNIEEKLKVEWEEPEKKAKKGIAVKVKGRGKKNGGNKRGA